MQSPFCPYGAQSAFWTLPARFLADRAAAIRMAIINAGWHFLAYLTCSHCKQPINKDVPPCPIP